MQQVGFFNLSITVNPVNDAPVITAQNGTLTTAEDTPITLNLNNVTVNDIDHPGYPTGFTMTVSSGANYTFSGLQITPAANFTGTLTVPVFVTDPAAANSNSFNLSISVTAVNDAPVINTQNAVSTAEGHSSNIVDREPQRDRSRSSGIPNRVYNGCICRGQLYIQWIAGNASGKFCWGLLQYQ